ncbi:MAG: cation:dicarboxylase symporter family transporter [Cyanobacteriota bacterium]|nr:cation:dicarboxylase symporter family transporter [Cyanobacteriota bacterium]
MRRTHLPRLWPQQIGNQCLVMLAAGALLGWLAPGQVHWLQPLARAFLQASQIVVMPFLICELVVGFGKLNPGALGQLARRGGLILIGLWLAASVLVVVLPQFLPPLVTSEFYHAGLFDVQQPKDLLGTYLPDNIFTALAKDNFPAVVLFSCLLGILLQGIERRDDLLSPLVVMRDVFKRLNKLVVRMIPYGIFALIAINIAAFDSNQIIRIQGFFALCLISFVVLSLGCIVTVLSLTPLGPRALWQIVKGPLALTASSANLLIALPMLVSNLQEQLPPALGIPPGDDRATEIREEIAPLVSLGFSLPTLGQVSSLIFIPFSAWYVDRSLDPQTTVHMLLGAIPATVSGLKAVVRQELLDLGLPVDLQQLVYVNGEWLYRFEKVLGLEGLVVLAVMVYALGVGAWKPQPLRALAGLLSATALVLGLGWGSRISLAAALRDSYRNDDRLLALSSTRTGQSPRVRTSPGTREAVNLQEIQRRRVLRAGLPDDVLPWAFRNANGDLVGFDVDLLKSLAKDLGVSLELRQAPLMQLEGELSRGQLDLVAGGIQNTPNRAIRHELSRSYQGLNLALVVPDAKVRALQDRELAKARRPITLAVLDETLISYELEAQIAKTLGTPGRRASVNLEPIHASAAFFSDSGQRRFDGLLVPAEAGAGLAVLHPKTTLITPFGRELNSEVVLMVGGRDASLRRYLNGWLNREISLGRIQELFDYWILLKDG